MFWKNIVGTFHDSWRFSAKPALLDALRNPDPLTIAIMVTAMGAPQPRRENEFAPWHPVAQPQPDEAAREFTERGPGLPLHPAPQPQTHEAAVAAPQARPAATKKTSQMAVDPRCMQTKDEKALAPLHPDLQSQTLEAAVATPQARPAATKRKKKLSPTAVERGRKCVQVKGEMKQIKYMTRERGMSIKEIKTAWPDFRFWDLVESDALSDEDRETALHPNRWEAGYSTLLLSSFFKVAKITIRDYITAYNHTVGNETPRAH